MAIHTHFHGRIFPLFETMAEALQEARPSQTDEVRDSHNMTIILCRACLVEGVLEEQAYRVIEYYRAKYRQVNIPEFTTRKPVNTFVNRMIEDLESRVGRSTGIENFSTLLNSLLGSSLLSDPSIAPCAEGIRVMFQLRNVIAHGRAVRASIQLHGLELDNGEEDFRGGYSMAEKYLLKTGIIDKKFTSRGAGNWIFSDGVTDHFTLITGQFMSALVKYIDTALEGLEKSTIAVPRQG